MTNLQNTKSQGSVYTKPIIVQLILDLVGYTEDIDLTAVSLLDPSYGDAVFLEEAVHRLFRSYIQRNGDLKEVVSKLKGCIKGVELNPTAYRSGRERLLRNLLEFGLNTNEANKLLDHWLVQTDFLLWQNGEQFGFIVGNPPYVRQELIPDALMKQYRKIYSTIYDRADLYVPFIQRGLELLSSQGQLGYICTDRFVRNQYGKKLREFITTNYQVCSFVDLHKTSPFENEVAAYPSIFVISQQEAHGSSEVRAAKMESVTLNSCDRVRDFILRGEEGDFEDVELYKFPEWFRGDSPWIIESQEYLEVLQYFEKNFDVLEDEQHGIKVGIGVATGADKVYIVKPQQVDVEDEVLVPLVMTKDIDTGQIAWSGKYVINPFTPDGGLVDLNQLPKLNRYFEENAEAIKGRNVAKRNSDRWYRTIDRIYPELVFQPKLLIPDIKGENLIVKDDGQYYPHHNLYYILPGNWNIDVLRSILMSSITKFFIWSYATKMRGDYLRYQAQYLRKIRLPHLLDLDTETMDYLRNVDPRADLDKLDSVVASLYNLTERQFEIVKEVLS